MALVSPPSSPTIELRRCEALLVDEETVCKVPIRSHRGRFCNAHGREYVHLTRAYKAVSKTVEELKGQAWLSRKQLRALQDIFEVDSAISLAEEWRDAIAEEILARQVQHRRFFTTKDKGHQQWLEHLAICETRAEGLITRLRDRRLEIVSATEARRRIDKWAAQLRKVEAARAARAKELQRQIQEAGRPLGGAAHTARTSTTTTPAPAPPARTVPASPSADRVQRPTVYYSAGGFSAHSYDLEGQMPVGRPDGGWNASSILYVLFCMLLLWLFAS
ncbi:hypothetical protein L226DRAFT_539690 [Lentinus tigrinus ALCF2SS1-7]|uniref:Uncharacterized protein n=1 Tax=Lentinus tigrinus ALCF2SS1-6 TaxID=1328759 RepID=A0A5C2S8V0_9APHY|nr:hypothetical protein L227DRAFT_575323 [Lentinus tigrinus ALCF2SS1-6]RPD69520.1 hypothetical protein L226DRAFT_539690 [Lentinus tigrinus ALCF2SS1-7]